MPGRAGVGAQADAPTEAAAEADHVPGLFEPQYVSLVRREEARLNVAEGVSEVGHDDVHGAGARGAGAEDLDDVDVLEEGDLGGSVGALDDDDHEHGNVARLGETIVVIDDAGAGYAAHRNSRGVVVLDIADRKKCWFRRWPARRQGRHN